MLLKTIFKSLPAYILCLPLCAASQTFLPQGPGPSTDALLGAANTEAGSLQPVAVSPIDSNTIFIGGNNGGIWKTTNGGTSWTPQTDHLSSLSIQSLAFDSSDGTANTLLAGAGISSNGLLNNSLSGGSLPGTYYTTNGGTTWTPSGWNSNSGINSHTINAVLAQGNVLFAGTFNPTSFYNDPSSTGVGGLWKSTNTGATATEIILPGATSETDPVTAIVTPSGATSPIYVAITRSGANTIDTALYQTTDLGMSFTPIFTSANSGGVIRAGAQTVLKVAAGPVTGPSTGSIAVAIVDTTVGGAGTGGEVVAVYLSTDRGTTWNACNIAAVTAAGGFNPDGQGVINSAVAVDQNTPTIVYASGTFNGGSPFPANLWQLSTASPAINLAVSTGDGSESHADTRSLVFDGAGSRLLVTSDGGIESRVVPGTAGVWTSLNGTSAPNNLALWQSYACAYDANNNLVVAAGQDTSCALQNTPNSTSFTTFSAAGDGVNAVCNDVTQAPTSILYYSVQDLSSLTRVHVTGGVVGTKTALFLSGGGLTRWFFSGITLNRINPTHIAFGGVDNVATTIDSLVGNTLTLTSAGSLTNAFVGPMSFGTVSNNEALLVGATATQQIYYSPNAPTVPLALVAGYSGLLMNAVVFDTRTSSTFFVANAADVVQTINTGTSFTQLNISGTFPNLSSFSSLEFLSSNGVNALFVGGISSDGVGSNVVVADSNTAGALSGLRRFGTGGTRLPNTYVNQLSYNPTSDTLLASLYGRSTWLMYDVTSNFPAATQLQFGFANNDSSPDASALTDGVNIDTSAPFVRGLVKNGTGTLTISNAATYSGTTAVNNGTMLMNVANGLNNVTPVIVSSPGILNLNNFALTVASLAGNGNVSLGTGTLSLNTTGSTTFSGAIGGTGGNLVIEGSGTQVLSGTSNYTGTTTLSGTSTLNLDGTIASSVLVQSGATLKGTGINTGSTTVQSGGTINPGNPIGTITLGTLTLNAGSFTNIEINPSNSSVIAVTGAATVGGSVNVIVDPGSYPASGSYDFLTAASVAGSYNPTVLGGAPGFTFSLVQQPTFVQLLYTFIAPPIPAVTLMNLNGISGNARTFGKYINRFAPTSQAEKLLAGLSGNALQKALISASPLRNGIPIFIIDNLAFSFINMLESHFSEMHYDNLFSQENSTSIARSPRTFSPDELLASNTLAVFPGARHKKSNPKCIVKEPTRNCEKNALWVNAFGDLAHQKTQKQTPEFNFNNEGLVLGYDRFCNNNAMLGVAAGYAHSNYHMHGHQGKGDINTGFFAPYGTAYFGHAFLEVSVLGAYNKIDNHRHIKFTGFDSTASSSFHAWQIMPHLGFGYDIKLNDWFVFEPFATVDWVVNWQHRFNEHGGKAFDMKQKSHTSSMLRSEVGLRLYQNWEKCWGTIVLREVAAFVNKAPNKIGRVTAALVGFPSSFTVESFSGHQNLAAWGISGLIKGNSGWFGMLGYDGEAGSGYVSNEIQLKFGKFF